jgi:hypothetical protein
MRTLMSWKASGLLVALVVALGFPAGGTHAATVWIQAEQFVKTMPDSTPVTMWGFRLMDTNWTPLAGQSAQVPGPRLVVPPGEGLTVNLRNALPDPPGGQAPPISFVIPGQMASSGPVYFPPADPNYPDRVRSFAAEAVPGGGTVSYTWTNLKGGTYLYQSGTQPQVQVQMGLYGACTKDYAAGQAYSGVPYTAEVVLLYSEVDPALHAAVVGGNYGPGKPVTSTMEYEPKYFLVNGVGFPDPATTLPSITMTDQVLMRFLNAGLETHVPLLQGIFMNLVAEDGNKSLAPAALSAPYPRHAYSLFLPAGQTADAVLLQPFQPGPCNFPIYDRALHLTNAAATGGGMYAFLPISNPGSPPTRVGDTLKTTKGAGTIQIQWTDLPGTNFYTVYENFSVGPGSPPFTTVAGRTMSGTPGLSLPMPAASLVFYLVAAGAPCGSGDGPQN